MLFCISESSSTHGSRKHLVSNVQITTDEMSHLRSTIDQLRNELGEERNRVDALKSCLQQERDKYNKLSLDLQQPQSIIQSGKTYIKILKIKKDKKVTKTKLTENIQTKVKI